MKAYGEWYSSCSPEPPISGILFCARKAVMPFSVSGAFQPVNANTPPATSCCACCRPRAGSSWSSRMSSTILWPLTPPDRLTRSKYALVACAEDAKLMAPVCVTIAPTLIGAPAATTFVSAEADPETPLLPGLPAVAVVVVVGPLPAVLVLVGEGPMVGATAVPAPGAPGDWVRVVVDVSRRA